MAQDRSLTQYEAMKKKRIGVSAAVIFLVVPAILALSSVLAKKQLYLPLSLLILVSVMAPFFMVFEKRKPKAREIVLIAMMCALTVAAQLFFHVVFPLQIGTALVIVAGISLGPEAGFLIGALSRFVCNFYMGQGAWTPWQMFCWGILGFLAGLCFNKGDDLKVNSRSFRIVMGPLISMVFAELAAYASYLIYPGTDSSIWGWRLYIFGAAGLIAGALIQRKRLPMDSITPALFTFFTTFVIYGGIMNFATMVMSIGLPGSGGMSFETLRALYVTGFPYDLAHSLTAAICIFIFGEPLIKKLERIKIKYGIYR